MFKNPPYYGTEKYYQAQFSKEDHERLANVLKNIKGKFLLSYNDCDYIRDLYREYDVEAIQRNHNLLNRYEGKDNIYSELLIRKY